MASSRVLFSLDSVSTDTVIAIIVPLGVVFVGVIVLLLVVVCLWSRKKKSDEPYAFRPLSDNEEGEGEGGGELEGDDA